MTSSTSLQPLGETQVLCSYELEDGDVFVTGVSINGFDVDVECFAQFIRDRWEASIYEEIREDLRVEAEAQEAKFQMSRDEVSV